MINLKSLNGLHLVSVNGVPKVFPTLVAALKYIAARY